MFEIIQLCLTYAAMHKFCACYNPHMTIMTIMVTILVTILSILVRIITRGGQRHMIFLIFYGTQVATTF